MRQVSAVLRAQNTGKKEHDAPLRVREPVDAPRGERVAVDLAPPRAAHPCRKPAHVALVAERGVPAPEDVTRAHADDDSGEGAGERLLGAEEGAGEREAGRVAAEEAAEDGRRRVAQREHDDGQDGDVCGREERLISDRSEDERDEEGSGTDLAGRATGTTGRRRGSRSCR